MLTTVLAALLIGLATLFFFKYSKIPKGFPPGPKRLPIFGSLLFVPQIAGLFSKGAEWFIERYGKLVGFYLGNHAAVIIYDYDIAKDLFSRESMAGRPDSFVYSFRMLGSKLGLLFNDGDGWKSQRRFVLKTLKDFGFGKRSLEGVLTDEADKIAEFFRMKKEEPILVQNLFNLAILNVLWSIVASYRYELTDPKAQELVKLITESIQVEKLRFLFAIPFSRHIAPEWTGWNKQKQVVEETQVLMKKIIQEHKDTYDENYMRDFIDVYLRELSITSDSSFNDDQLIVNAMDLFSAGSETTATTLAWAVAFMIVEPQAQKAVQEEIDQVIGDRVPSLDDRVRMPLTEATIMEIQRLGSIAPQAVPHRALEDITIRGYKIPRGTYLFSMLYYIMRDPTYWKDPERFNPSRFLDENGKLIREQRFIPFGVGKRLCIGESLAKSELFIIFTRLMQLFTFENCEGYPAASSEPVAGFIMAPKPFYAKARLRT